MSGLGNNIGYKILKKKRKKEFRQTKVHNFKTAKSAYIIFDTSVPESIPVIKEFRKFLTSEKIKSQALGMVPQKEIPSEILLRDHFSYITKKDTNWFKQPKGEIVEKFMNEEPDILFDFTFGAPLEVKYLVQLSKADFKVGCFTEDDNDYDLMINTSGDCKLDYLVEQIRYYINMLNPS